MDVRVATLQKPVPIRAAGAKSWLKVTHTADETATVFRESRAPCYQTAGLESVKLVGFRGK